MLLLLSITHDIPVISLLENWYDWFLQSSCNEQLNPVNAMFLAFYPEEVTTCMTDFSDFSPFVA